MNGGSAIGGWRSYAEEAPAGRPLDLAAMPMLDGHAPMPEPSELEPEHPAPIPREWRAGAVAIGLSFAWIVLGLWLARASLPGMDAPALLQFVAALLVVPLAAGVALIATRRTSRTEARRFGHVADAMRGQAAALERSVASLAAVIDANQARLAEQMDALDTLGTQAGERLRTIGSGLTGQIAEADRHAATLAAGAGEAQASLDALLAQMPRARDETLDAAEALDRAATAAAGHAAGLDRQVAALEARGHAANEVTADAARRLADHLSRMESTGHAAGTRLEAVTARMAEAVDALLERTAQAVDGARQGIAAQGEAMLAMVGAHQATLDAAARESAEALAGRVEVIELVIERIARRLDAQRAAGDALVAGLEGGIGRVGERLDALHAQGSERSQLLAASISALGGSADAMTEALRAGDAMATRAIGTAEALLIALDSAAREMDETLPDALDRLDRRIGQSKQVVVQAKPELLALVTAAESTHDAIEAIAQVIAGQRATLDKLSGSLHETLTSGRVKADALGTMVDETVARAHRFAEEAAPRLVDALLRVRDTATVAAERARATLADVIPEAAEALSAATSHAMERAATHGVEAQLAAMAAAADTAAAAAERAARRMGDRLRELGEQAVLVDQQVETARIDREQADRDSFARRVPLLIESLNSASIDITKSFAPEVADSAWAAYLKGDRGVFTRRAVRLLDAGDARDVARLYDDHPDFRDQVNRYIHDFEAMLRSVLAQRDGSPLGVTLLSSDMGKLYVALAQAIERLR